MNKVLRFGLFIFISVTLVFVFSADTFAVTGPGPLWQFVRTITLSNATPSNNFQAFVSLTAGQYGGMNASGNDLRFYDNNDNPCNYFIDTWNTSGTSTIWVKVPFSGTTLLYMYYGNGSAGASSNADLTFILYDHFAAGSLDGTKWGSYQTTGHSEAITVSGTNVTLSCGSVAGLAFPTGAQIIGKNSFNVSDGVIVETALGGTATSLCGSRGSLCGASNLAPASTTFNEYDLTTNYQFAVNGNGNSGAFGFPGYQSNGSTLTTVFTYQPNGNNSGGTIASGTTLGVYYTSSNIYYYRGGVQQGASNSTPPSGTIYPILSSLRIPDCMANGTNNSVIIDYIRVRKKYSNTTDLTGSAGAQANNNLAAIISTQTNVNCFGQSTGSATVSASGGSVPYTYAWNTSPQRTTQTISTLSASSYIISVTDAIGLTTTATATITQPSAALSGGISTKTNVSCFDGNNGSATVTVSNGTSPYTFLWSDFMNQSTPTAGNLIATNFTVTVTDNHACTITAQASISQPTVVTVSSTSANIGCNGASTGSITLTGGGGTPSYQYSINNGNPFGSYPAWQSSSSFTGLPSGQYKIRAKDSNGCMSALMP